MDESKEYNESVHFFEFVLIENVIFFDTRDSCIIPNAINNFIFELRESCRQIDDHKQHSINAIQCR
ncbi:MAG: hypothetical protein KGZ39_04475, partial [Simkania sp.]|nr:hypothetical protein [Simkania sp.]